MSAGRALSASMMATCIVVLWVDTALGCSVCVGADTPDTRNAWIAMTAFMTFTPLSIVVGVAFWLRHRFRALEASEREDAMLGRTDAGPANHGPFSA